jgi:DNA polymerase-3 subunit gamma/tau
MRAHPEISEEHPMAPYQVLARKYRPQRFAEVIGQEHVTQTLLNALAQNRIAHGYIFSGHRGIGKTTIARILAMALECRTPQGSAERPTPEPCGICEACTEIRAGSAIDIIEIDAATNRGIDEIRELREGARYSPARDKYKIYILDEAHQITDAAFNALLKTLEEPPAHVIFMMATTQPEDIPQTIRSRCQHFSFHAVRFQEIVSQLRSIAAQEGIEIDDDALSLLAEAGDGSMRDALSILDQAIASAPVVDGKQVLDAAQVRALMGTVSNQVFEQMMESVAQQDAAGMLEQAAHLLDAGNSPQQIARQMVRFLRNCLMAKLAGPKSELLQISHEESARAGRIAEKFSEEDLTRFLNSMLRTFDDLGYRQEQRFHLELGLLKLVHMQRLLPFEELFRQLGGNGAGNGNTTVRNVLTTNAGTAPKLTASVSTAPPAVPAAKPIAAPVAPANPLEGVFSATANAAAMPVVEEKNSMPPVSSPQSAAAAASISTPAPAVVAPSPPDAPVSTIDTDELRTKICMALNQGGHETISGFFETGLWQWDGSELRIQIGMSKTMLGMSYTTHAQQVVRDCFRQITNSARPVKVEPGEVPAQTPKPTVKLLSSDDNGNEIRPQDHPLIRHAQELFRADIRSVVSLRDSQS